MRVFFVSILILCAQHNVSAGSLKSRSTATGHGAAKDTQLSIARILKGTKASLCRQNLQANREKLARIEDERQLLQLRRQKKLVRLPASKTVVIDRRLKPHYRYCRPWTSRFLLDLGGDYYRQFHKAIQVNSAVRTCAYQEKLRVVNSNAAPTHGETASPHLTGSTVDLSKKAMTPKQVGWIRGYLYRLEQKEKIDATEEFSQAVFHVMVFKSYSEGRSQTAGASFE
ncbi:MAG TPA: DUF5715 family protein [Acidobacteriota bacterium]|nr:DUF5715 family protein [Acidobacteriota bacterium]